MKSDEDEIHGRSRGPNSQKILSSWHSALSISRAYKYQALPSPRSIRLLKVRKYSGFLKHRYRLEIFSPEDAPEYHALSYSWGHAIKQQEDQASALNDEKSRLKSRKLSLDGRFLPITGNLCDFLDTWAPKAGTSYIWIDAICINQEDLIEKNWQVPLMGEIYSSAKQVIIWLGSSMRHIESLQWICGDFYDAVAAYVKRYDEESLKSFAVISSELNEELGVELSMVQSFNHWNAFIDFTHDRRWFSRTWVVQEVALAKDLFVMCGNDIQLRWEAFARLPKLLSQRGAGEGQLREASSRLETYDDVKEIFESVMTESSKNLVMDHRLESIAGGNNPRMRWYAAMFLLLLKTRYLDTSDPRDSIYAILGIANKALPSGMDPPIVPNYELSAKEAFIDVSACLLQNLPGLVFLSQTMPTPTHHAKELPSWVSDLHYFSKSTSSIRALSLDVYPGIPSFTAWPVSSSTLPPVTFGGDMMIIRAGEFDTITTKATLPNSADISVIKAFLAFCLALDPIYVATNQSRAEAIWRTMIADTAGGNFPAPDEEKEGIRRIFLDWTFDSVFQSRTDAWISELPWDVFTKAGDHDVFPINLEVSNDASKFSNELERGSTSPNNFLSTVTSIYHRLGTPPSDWITWYDSLVVGRAIFKTKKGYIGIGPYWAECGDAVCLLEGGKVPFILKKTQRAEQYEFVGEAYVHGIMHGQAINSEFMNQVKQINIV